MPGLDPPFSIAQVGSTARPDHQELDSDPSRSPPGSIPPSEDTGTVVWDTSKLLPDTGIVGRALRTLVGYSDRPTGLQLIVYLATLALIFSLMKLLAPPPPVRTAPNGRARAEAGRAGEGHATRCPRPVCEGGSATRTQNKGIKSGRRNGPMDKAVAAWRTGRP